MNEQLISQVEDLGLSNKEARVYVANLMTGPAGVQQIADASGIKRVTTYVILESLVNLGLVSQTSKAKKTLFNAESPENLRRLLEKKEQSLAEQKQSLGDLIPELKHLTSIPQDAPVVKLYDSAEGIQTLVRDYLSEYVKKHGTKTIYGLSNTDRLREFFPHFTEGANPDRLAAKIESRMIYTSTEGAVMKGSDESHNRTSRYLPPEKFPMNCDFTIIGDSVVMLSLSGNKPIGIAIQSAEIAEGMRVLFNLSWVAAETV